MVTAIFLFKDTYQQYHGQKFCTIMEESIKPQAYKRDWKQFLVDCVCSRKGISFCDTHLWPLLGYMPGAEGGCPSQPYSLSLHAFSLFCFSSYIYSHPTINPLPCTWHRHHFNKLKYKPCIDLLFEATYLKLLSQTLKPTMLPFKYLHLQP